MNSDLRDSFFGTLYELAVKDKNVTVLTADMGVNEFKRFRELKGQFYNVGISEQNMVSMSAGLALSGKKVFIYSIIPFLTQRAFEQIKVDICGMKLPVTLIGGCAGLSNSTDGATHHAVRDISVMRTLDIEIYNPSNGNESAYCARYAYESKNPVYARLDKIAPPVPPIPCNLGDGMSLLRKGEVMIIATGNMVQRALETDYGVIDVFRLKPLSVKSVDYLKGVKRIITLEEHLNIGLGSIISEYLTDHNLNIPLKRLGVSKQSPIGSREFMQTLNGLDVESIKCN